jgi:hypothetical protein
MIAFDPLVPQVSHVVAIVIGLRTLLRATQVCGNTCVQNHVYTG